MKMFFTFLGLLLALLWLNPLQAQHQIETKILKNSTTQRSSFYHLTHTGWATLHHDKIKLQRLESEESGHLEFTIDHFSNVDIQIGLELANATLSRHAFRFLNGEVWIANINYGTCGKGSIYRVERCDTSIKYFKDGVLFSEENIGNNLYAAVAFVDVAAADLDNTEAPSLHLAFPFLNNCTSTENYFSTTTYADLQKRLDGGVVYLTSPHLRFRFYESFATGSNNEELDYTIYREDGIVAQSGSLDKQSGENKFSIGLQHFNNYYLLEVADSKGEKYFLRFLYYCPDPTNCPVVTGGGGTGG